MIEHIIEREIIHFFSGGTVYLIAFFGIAFCQRKWKYWTNMILPGVLAALCIFLREPFDVAAGGWIGKSYIDLAFWLLGIGAVIYGLYRFPKILERMNADS